MGDPRISKGAPPPAPAMPGSVEETDKPQAKTETKTPAKTDQQQAAPKSIPEKDKKSQIADHSTAGNLKAAQLKSKVPGKSGGDDSAVGAMSNLIRNAGKVASGVVDKAVSTAVEATKPLSVGSKGPAVETAQRELNKWRAENGRKPIQENGVFGSETEAAVLDFQKANGLNQDCIYGANTRDRLALENDPKFKALNDDTKKQVRGQMKSYEKDQTARNNLHDLATDSNFGKLSRDGQDKALQGLHAEPASAFNLKNVKENAKDRAALEADPNFKKLPEPTRTEILNTMERYAFEPQQRQNLMKLATEPGLGKLSPANQEQVLKTHGKNPADGAFTNQLKQIVGSQSFEKMDDTVKARALALMAKNPLHSRYNEQVADLISHKNFGAMSAQQQAKTLNLFESTTMDGRAALIDVMKKNINGTPALLSKTTAGNQTLLDQLDRLNNTNLSPRIVEWNGTPVNKQRVVEDLLKEIANPHRNIDQSNRGTCTCTSMTFNLALSNPAEYARIATDLATMGQSMLAGGVMITPPADGFPNDNSTRSVSERLFQSALMNYGQNGNYQNSTRNKPSDPLTDTGGLDLDQQIKVLNALHGKSYKSVPNLSMIRHYPGVGIHESAPETTKKELDAGRGPVYARLNWDDGGHAVEITKIENGRVYFRNPWGGNIPGVSNGVGIDYQRHKNPPRRVEDSAHGIESMSERDYEMYLKSIIVAR